MSGGLLTPLAGGPSVQIVTSETPYGSFAVPTVERDRHPSFNLKKQPSELLIDEY